MPNTSTNTKSFDKSIDVLTRDEVDYVFRLDFIDILGIDLWNLLLDIDMMKTHPNYLILDNPISAEIRSILQENVSELISKYFNYQEERFPNPIDQYRWIVNSEFEIRALLGRNLDVPYVSDIKDNGDLEEGCPLKHYQNALIQKRFEKLFAHLVKVGETHKFSRATIALRLDEESEED